MYHSVCKGFLLYRDWVAHATLTTHATLALAALGVIFQAFPLYVPLSPVARAERCKPCLVTLTPTLCFFRPLTPGLLLTRALSGSILPGSVFMLKFKWSLFSRTSIVIPQEKKHRLTHTHTLSLVPRRARVRAAGERRFTIHCRPNAHEPTARSAF